jgi:hypothetical protein
MSTPENVIVKKGFTVPTVADAKEFVQKNLGQMDYKVIAMVVAGIAVLVVGIIFLKQYFDTKVKENSGIDEVDDDGEKTCEIIFFFTTWCPYCKKFLPAWKDFSAKWNGKTKNGYQIIMTEVDCDQEEAVANRFNVTGYPTIKCVKDGKTTDFDAKPTPEALNQFLNSCFNE